MVARLISLLSIFVFCLLGIVACSGVSDPSRTNASNGEMAASAGDLRRAVDSFYTAWYDSNWDLMNSFYADDVVYIDSAGDHMSLDEQNAKATEILEKYGSPVFDDARENLVHEVRVNPTGDAGVAYWTFPWKYQTEDGVSTIVDYAESDVWWKVDGKWKIVLIHYHEIPRSYRSSE